MSKNNGIPVHLFSNEKIKWHILTEICDGFSNIPANGDEAGNILPFLMPVYHAPSD